MGIRYLTGGLGCLRPTPKKERVRRCWIGVLEEIVRSRAFLLARHRKKSPFRGWHPTT